MPIVFDKLLGRPLMHSHAELDLKAPLATPVFTTNITTPLIIGGTAVGSKITYKSTTGAGTAAGIAHQFIGGTDGATVAATILNTGNVGIGTTAPGAKLDVNGGEIRVKSQSSGYAFRQYRNDGPNLFNVDDEGRLDGGIRGYVQVNDNLQVNAGKWARFGGGSLTFYGSGNTAHIGHGATYDGTSWTRVFDNYLSDFKYISASVSTSLYWESTDASTGTPNFISRIRFYVDGSGTKGGQLTIGNGDVPVANLDIKIQDSSTVGQIIKAASSQIADLQQWQNSAGTSLVVIDKSGNVGIGTTSPSSLLAFGGNSARVVSLERHTTANTAGNTLTITAGGATSGATDKAGGALILQGGLSTGSAESGVTIQGVVAGASGTTDRIQTTAIQVLGNKIGIFSTTPAVQQNTIIDADGTLADITTKFNTLLASLEAYGWLKAV